LIFLKFFNQIEEDLTPRKEFPPRRDKRRSHNSPDEKKGIKTWLVNVKMKVRRGNYYVG
jgi:hypothetical protein